MTYTIIKIVLFSIGLAISIHKIIKGIKTKNLRIIDIIAGILFAMMLVLNFQDLEL